jgi:hypothetical protein
MSRILRHEVPVDDRWHEVQLGLNARILAVAARQPDVVEFWAEHHAGEVTIRRRFRVHGTGHEIESGMHVGTTLAAGGALVWHLFEEGA